jgi:hypothetical protein
MANGNFVPYLRVSTARQGVSGSEAQKAAVNAHLNGGDWKIVAELVEVESAESAMIALSSSRRCAYAGCMVQPS